MSETRGHAAFAGLIDLVSSNVGGQALLCSDDYFASMHNLVKPEAPEFDPNAFYDRGKVTDGWESRRKRVPGHDWCILRLGIPGVLRGVDIDTSWYLGNHPPFASLEATVAPEDATGEWLRDHAEWTRILPETALKRGSSNLAAISSPERWTHVRFNIYPDGGVARLRLYGEPRPAKRSERIDLAALANGGRPLACSDMFFSSMTNLFLSTPAEHMGHGWETRRSRPPGIDWIIVALGQPGLVDEIVVDTAWFKGNYPDRVALDALYWPDAPPHVLIDHPDWTEIVAPSKCAAHAEHAFSVDHGPVTHIRMRMFPDGGASRLRVFGRPTQQTPADADPWLQRINALTAEDFLRCCGSRRWAQAMVAGQPYTSRTHLFGHADQVWWHLGDGDWREAFTHHPRIGANVEALRDRFASTASWSAAEQSGVAGAAEEVLQALADGNQAYEERFGHIFIVCATGLTADAMLRQLRDRLTNEPEAELRVAAGEQAKITRLRLQKLEG